MATNKNQHFVPRCYLRPFTVDEADAAINLYNIDRKRFISNAPVKHQCSGDYFYGKDDLLEAAIRSLETAYARVLREVLAPNYSLRDEHRVTLRRFWLLQHLRTEQASVRAVEMTQATETVPGIEPSFRLQIRDAVQMAMRIFARSMHAIDDLKVCLIRNRTQAPFVTSDDPSILGNRWHQETRRARWRSFGMNSAGAILILPLSPRVLCLGYDGDVYSVPHTQGWVETRRESDIHALNELQFLNCRANIFVRDDVHSTVVHDAYLRCASRRTVGRHVVRYAVLDHSTQTHSRYRVVERKDVDRNQEALIHSQVVHPRPYAWPAVVHWRPGGSVFTNDTGLGYVRRSGINALSTNPFRREAL